MSAIVSQYGATKVYGEEIVADRIIGCERRERLLPDGSTVVGFYQPANHPLHARNGDRAVFATTAGEPVVFQVRVCHRAMQHAEGARRLRWR